MGKNQHDKLFENIEANIRQHAKYQKLTLSELAASIDMTEAGFYKMLSTESIKVKTLKKISEVLRQPIHVFFEEFAFPIKSSRGYHKKQQVTYMAAEPEETYASEKSILQKQISLLESQVEDKNKIIELLNKKQPK